MFLGKKKLIFQAQAFYNKALIRKRFRPEDKYRKAQSIRAGF